jgi:predicted MFS family arabinose efflux permease
MALFGFVFLQLFSSVPIYYKDGHFLTEEQIGILLGANGLLIFLIEMPLIKYLEDRKSDAFNVMIVGTAMVVVSYLLFNLSAWTGILWVSMILISVGEVLVFPFSNAFALKRAERGNQGEYMSWYMVSFSVAHIFGHNSGMQMMESIGFELTWYILAGMGVIAMVIFWALKRSFSKEESLSNR